MNGYQFRARLEAVERMNNSVNGNPRFRIAYRNVGGGNEGIANTASDASFNYEMGNVGYRVGNEVIITMNARGTIASMASVVSE